MNINEKAVLIKNTLEKAYPAAECGLHYTGGGFRLLVMAVLSAQCTDTRVNIVSQTLFEKYPDARSMAAAELCELEECIRSVGLYRAKAKNLIAASRLLCDEFGGEIPREMDSLLSLPGVGRKIANLLRGDLFGLGGIVADTHCIRIAYRLGLAPEGNALKTETALSALIPPEEQSDFCHRLVLFGRETCAARAPRCDGCILENYCTYNKSEDEND